MHKNVLFLLKNCKNRPALPFAPGGCPRQTSIEKSWLRHCISSSKFINLVCL